MLALLERQGRELLDDLQMKFKESVLARMQIRENLLLV